MQPRGQGWLPAARSFSCDSKKAGLAFPWLGVSVTASVCSPRAQDGQRNEGGCVRSGHEPSPSLPAGDLEQVKTPV